MLQLYLDLVSQPCRSVYIFAKKNNIDFEFKQVYLFKGKKASRKRKHVNAAICKLVKDTPACTKDLQLLGRAEHVEGQLKRKHLEVYTHGSSVVKKSKGLSHGTSGWQAADRVKKTGQTLEHFKGILKRTYSGDSKQGSSVALTPFAVPPTTRVKKTGEHLTGEYMRVNPLRLVPALKDGDFTLAESIAILLYLSRKYNTPDHWYPADLQKRAQVDEYLSWQHMAVRFHGTKVFWCKVVTPILLGTEADPERIAAAIKEMNAILDQFEAKFLQDKPFIVGDEISLADLVAIVELMHPVGAEVDIFKDRPKLDAWRLRVETALGTELFQEAHKTILNCTKVKSDPLEPHVVEALKVRLCLFK